MTEAERAEAIANLPPKLAKSIHDELLHYYEEGMTLDQAADRISAASGSKLDPVFIMQAALARRGEPMSNEAWKARHDRLDIEREIRNKLYYATETPLQKLGRYATGLPRTVKLAGHGVPLFFTHTKPLITDFNFPFEPNWSRTTGFAGIWKDNVARGFKYLFSPDAASLLAQDEARIVDHEDYPLVRSLGLKVDPNDYEGNMVSAGPMKGFKGVARKAFFSLKVGRMQMWDQWKGLLDDPNFVIHNRDLAQMIVNDINHLTGAAKIPRGTVGRIWTNLAFAPQLTPSKWATAIVDPYVHSSRLMVHFYSKMRGGESLTPDELAVSRIAMMRFAKGIGYGLSALAASDAFQHYVMHDDDHRVNYFDLTDMGTWLRPRFGKYIMPSLPIVETLRMPMAFMGSLVALNSRQLQGTSPVSKAGLILWHDLLAAANPAYVNALMFATGKDPFTQQRIPVTGARQLVAGAQNVGIETMLKNPGMTLTGKFGEEPTSKPRQSWADFVAGQSPIQAEAIMGDIISSMEDIGFTHANATDWVITLTKAGLVGLFAGAGEHPWERGEKPTPLRQLPPEIRRAIQEENLRERLY